MGSLGSEFGAISEALARAFGNEPPRSPGSIDPFRSLLRYVLDAQRGLRVEQAIEALDRAGWSDDPEALSAVDSEELTDLLRDPRGKVPDGVVPLLLRVASWVSDHGGMDALDAIDTETLRDELRSIRGIGSTTANRVLLEVLRRPTFPISRSDYRILIRHGWIDPGAEETEAREVVEGTVPDDPDAMLRLAFWFESLGRYCKASVPRCDRCPLQPFLPEGGPLDPE
jgi:endonuclease-3 related protein